MSSAPAKMKPLLILAENSCPEKRKLNTSRCAPFHTETRASPKYPVRHCEPARPTGPAHPHMSSPPKSAIAMNNRFNLSIIRKLVKPLYLHCSCKKVVEKSNKENLKVIKITLPNKSGNPESLKKYSE